MWRVSLSVLASVLTLAGVALVPTTALAQHYHHDRYHDYQNSRQFQRYEYHQYAHQYPMTWGQHDRLHGTLRHAAYHDRLEHRDYHQPYYYTPYQGSYYYPQSPGFSFGYQNRNFSLYFGR